MNRYLLSAAVAASLATAGVLLSVGEAVDVEASWKDDAGVRVQGVIRCLMTADAGLDCGEPPGDGINIHGHDTAGRKYATLSKPGKADKRNEPCHCGPRVKPNQCRVKMAEGGNRESSPGEYIPAGGAEGVGCVERPCFELTEIISEAGGPGYSLPAACQ